MWHKMNYSTHKSVRLTKYHARYLKKKSINLSEYVRKKLDEDIKKNA